MINPNKMTIPALVPSFDKYLQQHGPAPFMRNVGEPEVIMLNTARHHQTLKGPIQVQVDPSFCVAIDLGVTNLAAITSNREGFVSRLVNGRTLKAINQWYNKRMKELMLCLPKEERERATKQMERITNKHNRRVNHYVHAASKGILDFLVQQGVGTVIIGKNPLWKQEVGMGKMYRQF